jgi:hypothetical protein
MPKPHHSRRIEVRVPSRDFSEGVRIALGRLGYELVPARGRSADPDARIVAADRLNRLSAEATAPIILFGGRRSRRAGDPRVIGVVRLPARLLDLYCLLQNALETHPRAVPRIPTSLAARSLRKGVDAPGAILSLSERGCLLRSAKSLPGDGSIQLQFALPDLGLIDIRAEPRHRAGEETGLAFQGLPEDSRTAIAGFVTRSLTRSL